MDKQHEKNEDNLEHDNQKDPQTMKTSVQVKESPMLNKRAFSSLPVQRKDKIKTKKNENSIVQLILRKWRYIIWNKLNKHNAGQINSKAQ